MRNLVIPVLAVIFLTLSCAPASPSPGSQPTKPATPTSGAASPAAPTAVPAKKVDYPTNGKAVTIINPWAPGGSADTGSRLLAVPLEKELGVPVEVQSRPGAGSQVGTTELAMAKPDGYTLGYISIPTTVLFYLTPDRKAAFTRETFQPIAVHVVDPGVIVVRSDSPYKSLKDLVDAAKANPEKIKASDTGVLGAPHLSILQFQKLAGVKFAIVHFDGGAPAATALLGGHTDVAFGFVGDLLNYVRSGAFRVLGIMDKKESKFLPGVKLTEAEGYKLNFSVARTLAAPGKTPKDVVDILAKGVKKSMDDSDHKKKMDEMGLELRYMDPAEFSAYWAETETAMKPLVTEALAGQK
ncbi:MAG: tripartite tricarboxylate transporter substrate binding protein [Chloroflexota bacterium]